MVVLEGARWTAAGLALGIVFSVVARRLLKGLLFDVRSLDLARPRRPRQRTRRRGDPGGLGPAPGAARIDPIVALCDDRPEFPENYLRVSHPLAAKFIDGKSATKQALTIQMATARRPLRETALCKRQWRQMDKQFGKGAVLRLGRTTSQPVSVISSGSLARSTSPWAWVAFRAAAWWRSSAAGVVRQNHARTAGRSPRRKRKAARPRSSMPNMPWIPPMRASWAWIWTTCWCRSPITASRRSRSRRA